MENQKQGHIALFRSLLSKDWAKDTAKLSMWVRLIGEAAYKPRIVEFSGKAWELMPGQLVTTAAIMGRKLRDQDGNEKSPQAVTRMLNFFAREGMITTKGTRFGTVISITNYGDYQVISPDEPSDRPSGNNKPSRSKALMGVPDEPSDRPSGEQNKKLLEQELKDNPLTPVGGDSQEVKSKPIPYEAIMQAYNSSAGNRLPNAEALNAKRRREIKRLWGELNVKSLEAVSRYFQRFMDTAKPFYFGENDTGWRANFDYLLRSDTLTKTREDSL